MNIIGCLTLHRIRLIKRLYGLKITRTIYTAVLIVLILIYPIASTIVANVKASSGLSLVGTYWGSVDNPQKVYPGSKNVRFIVQVRNDENKTITGIIGTLYLPTGITDINGNNETTATGFVKTDDTIKYEASPGEIVELDYVLCINDSLTPGTYQANLVVNYTYLLAGNLITQTQSLSIPLTISRFPTFSFELIEVYWTTTGGYRINGSPGLRNGVLNVVLRNIGEDDINRVQATLELPSQFSPQKTETEVRDVARNEMFTLTFSRISIDPEAAVGTYSATISLNCTFIGYGDAISISSYIVPITVKVDPLMEVALEIVKVEWQNLDRVYSGARGIYLDVTIQNLDEFTIRDIIANGSLPNGFFGPNMKSEVQATSPAALGYGDFVTLRFGPIYISDAVTSGDYTMNLTITAIASQDQTEFIVIRYLRSPLYILSFSPQFEVVSVEWRYNNQPCFAFPGSRNVDLVITIANRQKETLSALSPVTDPSPFPSGFKLKSVGGDLQRVLGGSIFTITFRFDIDKEVNPGLYSVDLSLKFNIEPETMNAPSSAVISFFLWISDPKIVDSSVFICDAYWGTTSPIEVYPGSKNAPLTIILLNRGPYDIHGLHIKVGEVNGIKPLISDVSVSSFLRVDDFSSTVVYFDINESVISGSYSLNITILYSIEFCGSVISKSKKQRVNILINSPLVSRPYIRIVDSSWANNLPVYPGTEDVTLELTLANEAPYPISGIHLKLSLPEGITGKWGNSSEYYVSGPIERWQTFVARFELDISSELEPGVYEVPLVIEYTLLSGKSGIRLTDIQTVRLKISGFSALEFVSAYWVGSSAGPGSAGVTLVVIVRNVKIPTMRGVVVTVKLPSGFISVVSGSNVFNITPVSVTPSQLEQVIRYGRISPRVLSELVSLQSPQIEVSKGEFLLVPMTLRISKEVNIGEYPIELIFSFLDQWGSLKKIYVTGSFLLPGSVSSLQIVEERSRLIIGSRFSKVVLYVKNNGTGSAYDVYIGLTSVSSLAAFSSTLKHFTEIPAGKEIRIEWTASASPVMAESSPIPALVMISYVDPAGYRRTINQTAILFVEGIAELKFTEISVEPTIVTPNSTFSISATVINVGTDTARNAEAFLESPFIRKTSDSYTFIGDIDKGAQMPIYLSAIMMREVDTVTIRLIIRYRTAFNEIETVEIPVNITVSKAVATTPEVPQPIMGLDFFKITIIVAVVAFLAISSLLMYKMYKRSPRRT